MREDLRGARRIVVKVGTGEVGSPDGTLALGRLGGLVEQIQALRGAGREVLLVSSGAVGLGTERLGLDQVPTGVVDRQACAAAGQGALVAFYDVLFRRVGHVCAQVLLTQDDFLNRRRYVNLSAALERLLAHGAIPIINENDTVATAELALDDRVFGDNDRLSALVASGLDADLLVLLSDVDAVYTGPPAEEGSERIAVFESGTPVRLGGASARGRGGMGAKLAAARVAAASGVHTVIASGLDPANLGRVAAGEDLGTWFPARAGLTRRRRWLAFATAPTGALRVNDGAQRALVERQASLLAPGLVGVEGDFEAGAVVSLRGGDGVEFGRGICDRASHVLRQGLGQPSARSRPLVHRDNAVIFAREEP